MAIQFLYQAIKIPQTTHYLSNSYSPTKPSSMAIQFLYQAIKIPQTITTTIVTNISSHIIPLLLTALSSIGLLKSPADPDDHITVSSGNYILILDGSAPSLLPVPVAAVTSAIKTKVPIIPFSDFRRRYGGAGMAACTVCLEGVDGGDMIRELVNCKHVFHCECLDRWVDVGRVNCPLCRSMLLPPKKLLNAVAGVSPATTASGGAPVV